MHIVLKKKFGLKFAAAELLAISAKTAVQNIGHNARHT
jgi:hypothetical protein